MSAPPDRPAGPPAGATLPAAAGPGEPPAPAPSSPWVWAVPLVGTLLALVVQLGGLDEPVFRVLNRLSHSTGAALWANITIFGAGEIAACLALPYLGRRPRVVFAVLLVALLCAITTNTIKHNVSARRPGHVLEDATVIGPLLRKNTFPSGHTATAFALAGLLAVASRRPGLRVGALLLACLVGLSRIVVGMHWPVDVAAGAALGWSCALLGYALAGRWRWGRTLAAQRALGLLLLATSVRVLLVEERYAQAIPLRRVLGVAALAWAALACWRLFRRGAPVPGC